MIRGSGITPKGFTLMEMLIVIAIIAILSLIAVPSLSTLLSTNKLRSEANILSVSMKKARFMSTTSHRPIRVVVDCRNKNGRKGACVISMQSAVFHNREVTSWREIPETRYEIDDVVNIDVSTDVPTNVSFDGAKSLNQVYWAIFMPGSHIFSDPRPFDIMIYSAGGNPGYGWRVGLDRASARVSFKSQN